MMSMNSSHFFVSSPPNNKQKSKLGVGSSEDLFSQSSMNDEDPFWKSNSLTTASKIDQVKSMSAEPVEVEKEKDVNGGDDLMDFFSSPSPSNTEKTLNAASMNERNRLKQKAFNHQQQSFGNNNDPFSSNTFGNNNDPFFSSNTNTNGNGNPFGNSNNNNGGFTSNGFGNYAQSMP